MTLYEDIIHPVHDGPWRVRVRQQRGVLPHRIDGRWRWGIRHYQLQLAPPAWPDQWDTVERTTADWHRWVSH